MQTPLSKPVPNDDIWKDAQSVGRHMKDVVDKAYIVNSLPRNHPTRTEWALWCLREFLRYNEWLKENPTPNFSGDDDESGATGEGEQRDV